jgi:glutamyl-tRNA synthetase
MIRVRFAPAPTGYLHVGGARTALFNWLFARHTSGKFILRIEDTDAERSSKESTQAIFDSLKWLGITWDEGCYYQSERRDLYKKYLDLLLSKGFAYFCFCTKEELNGIRSQAASKKKTPVYSGKCRSLSKDKVARFLKEGRRYSVRFSVPPGKTGWNDLVRGRIEFDNRLIGDFIIMRSNGTPTYNFAVVVDDHEMQITHVLRGDDHISNTPRQIMLYDALGFKPPLFGHLSMICGKDKKRLSKRHGATSIGYYRKVGFLPETLVNYLSLLGWSTSDSQQLFSREELIEKFEIERIGKTPCIFDYEKLLWMNGEYIRRLSQEELAKACLPYIEGAGYVIKDHNWFKRVASLYQERIKILSEIVSQARFFFEDVSIEKEAFEGVLMKEGSYENLKVSYEKLKELRQFTASTTEMVLRSLAKTLGVKTSDIFQPIRVSITGGKKSPGLFEIMELLGREKVLKRLQRAIHLIEERKTEADTC